MRFDHLSPIVCHECSKVCDETKELNAKAIGWRGFTEPLQIQQEDGTRRWERLGQCPDCRLIPEQDDPPGPDQAADPTRPLPGVQQGPPNALVTTITQPKQKIYAVGRKSDLGNVWRLYVMAQGQLFGIEHLIGTDIYQATRSQMVNQAGARGLLWNDNRTIYALVRDIGIKIYGTDSKWEPILL